MLRMDKALKVSIYLSEGKTRSGAPVSSGILDFLYFRGVSGATVLKGVAGFGASHHLHSASLTSISDHLPVKIEFIESREKVEELFPKLEEMVGPGIIEVQETTIAKASNIERTSPSSAGERLKIEGKARSMQIHIGESDKWRGKPLYEELVQAMRANDLAGVTVYRGILGYGAHRRVHRDAPLHLSRDRSIMLSVIDTEAKLRAFLPVVEQMVAEGLVVLSDVDIIKYAHRGPEAEALETPAADLSPFEPH